MLIVGISGSLRAGSSTELLLRALPRLLPPDVRLHIYDELATIPPFNPDLDEEGAIAPAPVAALRARLATADAVIVCSPEYAHGVPGVLKNALDWLVSTIELIDKPVVIFGRGEFVYAQLVETLTTMSWRVLPEASLRLPFTRGLVDAAGDITDASVLADVQRSLSSLVASLRR